MVYSVLNCLYRCYQIPLTRNHSPEPGIETNSIMFCEKCKNQIQGLFMNIGKDRFFHPECFSCTNCGQMIGDSQQYSKYLETLLCGKCSQRKSPPHSNTKNDINTTRKFSNSHVFRTYVPRAYINGLEFDLFDTAKRKIYQSGQLEYSDGLTTELFVRRVPDNINCGVFQLESDDRILEIEGVLILNQSIQDFQELFQNLNTTMVSIVIERKIPGQAMTPNIPLENISHNNQCRPQECKEDNLVNQPQTQRHIEATRKKAFPVKDKQTEIPNNTNQHSTLTKASGYPTHTLQMDNQSDSRVTSTQTVQMPAPSMKFSFSAPDPSDSNGSEEYCSSQGEFTPPIDDMDDLTTRSETALASIPNLEWKLESSSSLATGLSRLNALRTEDSNSIRRSSNDGFLFRPSDLILGRSLGNGFFGQVYLVTDSITGKKYAMKQLTREDSCSFKKELTILKSLSHPNILRFIGVFLPEKGGISLITEFLDGGTLNSVICKKETFPWLDRIRIARDIAAGMDYLHEHIIVHRDLNSHNVLLRKDLTAVVADFGLARTVEGEALKPVNSLRFKSKRNNCKTTTKPITMGVKTIKRKMTIVGSMAWMAPEMMKEKLYNEMVDVYSFGIILCELLSRLNPDPDFMPRNREYIVDWPNFLPKLPPNCPSLLIGLAQHTTQDDSDYRPPFEVCHIALQDLYNQMDLNQSINTDYHDCLSLLY
ncbi:Lim kinase [Oopsacas minuta]|uniref:Lim kinase n=1 Tax=Oopsacas minuta TaxID=111878 RepID=A0A127KTS9_9METZ|nr:Lim kinase [Oopsacas minuta]KAI6650330.1 Lim kinase [Oopsacas minuta]